MTRPPTRYHPEPIPRKKSQTAEPVTVVTGNSLPIAERARMRARALTRPCSMGVPTSALPPLPPIHFHCGLPTLSAKRHLATTTMNENYIDKRRTTLQTAQIRKKTSVGAAR